MKIKLITLTLCLTFILTTASSNKVKPKSVSGKVTLGSPSASVHFYHTDAFSKNKKQKIILAFWDNIPGSCKSRSNFDLMEDPTDITCNFIKSSSTVQFKCVGKFDIKSGKGKVNINGEKFDISNGRLFLINTLVKPIKVIQVNEQFNLPPFTNLSFLEHSSCFDNGYCFDNPSCLDNSSYLESFGSLYPKFAHLAKNNKIVAAFLADSKKNSEKNKSKDKKKKD